jgi:16S rRNA C967 or C1407 C5-methylase (RsmB/RsmF family)
VEAGDPRGDDPLVIAIDADIRRLRMLQAEAEALGVGPEVAHDDE